MSGRDLSGLTSPRSAGLSLPTLTPPLAPQASSTAADPAPVTQATEQDVEHAPEAAAPRPPRARATSTPAKQQVEEPTQERVSRARTAIPVYMPQALRERMDAALNGEPYNNWILDAFDATYDQLAEAFPALPARRVLPSRSRSRRRNLGPMVSVQIRPLKEELEVIDARAQELHVDSRSELLCRSIELRLGQA